MAISVAGDGVRLSPDHLARLFRSYPRLDEADSGLRTGGSALGLAICRGIVEAHGGRIWADLDGPGPGARFTFTIPAVEAETPITAPTALTGEDGTGRLRILAIDNDSQALGYLREALSQAGYVPLITRYPAEVPRLVREKRPHLALLDLALPGLGGIKLMEKIPELARVPVIFLSPYGDDHAVAQAMEAGGDDYLFKPFSPTELTARIHAVLRRRRRIEEPGSPPSAPYVLGDLRVDYDQGRAFLAGRPLRLTGIEYRLLCELSANAGRPLTHAQLLRRVWGQRPSGGSGPLRTTVKNLRRKLGDDASDPTYVFNKRSVGYSMAPSEAPNPRAGAPPDRGG